MRYFILILSVLVILSCNRQEEIVITKTPDVKISIDVDGSCFETAKSNGWVKKDGEKVILRGGSDSSEDFDITDWLLKPCQLRYGLGREVFHALVEPKYSSIDNLSDHYGDNARFIIVEGENVTKAYPISLLTHHEVINENIDSKPIMIVYCVLADLAAAYTRVYCDNEFTFALSGYTYHDSDVWNGLDGFVLWDRETESLWWPLIDKAVSGTMKNVVLEKAEHWSEIKWKEVKTKPNVQVLKSGQTMKKPNSWKQYGKVDCE